MTVQDATLGDVLAALWRARLFLLAGGVLGLACAALFLGAAVPLYRAEMIAAPAERGTSPDIKALLPDNSSFAVQYMLNTLGSADSNDFVRFENILRGPSVAARLLADPNIAYGVSAFRRFRFGPQAPAPHTAEELAAHLQAHVTITPVGTTALRRISYDHPDPAFARQLLARMYAAADALIKADIRSRTDNRTAWLENALETVDHPDHRRALTALLMEQEHIRMILSVDEPFAATLAEPPAAGPRPDWPKTALAVPAFVFSGMLIGYALFAPLRARRDA